MIYKGGVKGPVDFVFTVPSKSTTLKWKFIQNDITMITKYYGSIIKNWILLDCTIMDKFKGHFGLN